MSSALAISAVSAVLQYYLHNVYTGLTALFGSPIGLSAKAPDLVQSELGSGKTAQNQVNLFLHQVTFNPGWRNVDQPWLAADGKTQLKSPPLALDLHYLLTVYGSDDWQAEGLLGYALMMLHQNPVMTREDIRAAFLKMPVSYPGNPLSTPVGASGLADQIEMIKIIPSTLGREEMAWLWTALKADYRPTFPFQVSVVLMQPEPALSLAFPVLHRRIQAQPIAPAQILAVTPPNRQVSAAPGDTVTVTGEFLSGASQVSLTNARLAIETTAAATSVTSTSLQFVVPNDAVNFPAGIYSLSVLFNDATGNALQSTALLPLAVAPVIQLLPPPVVVESATSTQVTIVCNPNVRPSQSAYLALGSASVAAQPFDASTNTLIFVFSPALTAGPTLARLVVDGSPSVVNVDWHVHPPVFLGPMVTV
jgi:hypothetical protein